MLLVRKVDFYMCSVELEDNLLHDNIRRALDSGLLLVRKADSYTCSKPLHDNFLYKDTNFFAYFDELLLFCVDQTIGPFTNTV